jgi:hypothetical protein
MKDYKQDKDKIRVDLVDVDLIEGVAKVIDFGISKYKEDSWKTVKNGKNRYYGALLRHLIAYRKGELIDEESGLPHLDHIATNVMFLKYFDKEE